MALIPQIPLDKLPRIPTELRKLPSVEITDSNGIYLGTLIIPSMEGGGTVFDEIKTKAEYLGVQGNIVIPQSAIDNLATLGGMVCECGFVAKSPFGLMAHKRGHAVPV